MNAKSIDGSSDRAAARAAAAIRHYLALDFEDGDPCMIRMALGTVARARGMTALAREVGVKRGALYRALSETGKSDFSTIMKVLMIGVQVGLYPVEVEFRPR